jgi:hypothetical protein
MPYRMHGFDDNRGITGLAARRRKPAQGLNAMWSSYVIAFAAAVCAQTMSVSAVSEARDYGRFLEALSRAVHQSRS